MVFDYCPCNLYQALTSMSQAAKRLSEDQVRFVMKHLLTGLAALHSRGIVHRDIKPDNMLLASDNAKVCDFGQARKLPASQATAMTTYVATRWYRAPELLLGSAQYTPAVDLWAAGCTMAELYLGRPLFPGSSESDQLFRIASALGAPTVAAWPQVQSLLDRSGHSIPACSPTPLASLIPGISKQGGALLSSLLAWNPARRPSAAASCAHPFFAQGDTCPVQPVLPARRSDEVAAAQAAAVAAQEAVASLVSAIPGPAQEGTPAEEVARDGGQALAAAGAGGGCVAREEAREELTPEPSAMDAPSPSSAVQASAASRPGPPSRVRPGGMLGDLLGTSAAPPGASSAAQASVASSSTPALSSAPLTDGYVPSFMQPAAGSGQLQPRETGGFSEHRTKGGSATSQQHMGAPDQSPDVGGAGPFGEYVPSFLRD